MTTKTKGVKRHIHDNFRDLVVQASKANSTEFITQQVVRASQILAKDLADQLKPYDLLFDVFQDILLEQNEKLRTLVPDLKVETPDTIKTRVFDKEDKILGLTSEDAAVAGARVRFKLTDITKPESTQLLAVGKLGNTPPELNKDVEEAMLGMKVGERKVTHVKIQDKEYDFEIEVVRTSSPKETKV